MDQRRCQRRARDLAPAGPCETYVLIISAPRLPRPVTLTLLHFSAPPAQLVVTAKPRQVDTASGSPPPSRGNGFLSSRRLPSCTRDRSTTAHRVDANGLRRR